MRNNEEIKDLWVRYYANQCTIEEAQWLLKYIQSGENSQLALEMIENSLGEDLPELFSANPQFEHTLHEAFENIVSRITKEPQGKSIPLGMMRYAAAVAVFVGVGLLAYFAFKRGDVEKVYTAKTELHQIPAGINNVILTLADGSELKLDDASNELLAKGHHFTVSKPAGAIMYDSMKLSSVVKSKDEFHMISTSKGGAYQIVLSDGTKVWLNAASSLRYPVSFNGKFRNVELTGEGYFEVVKNADMPFQVRANKMQVIVLGTTFNINAYPNERAIKTTLLEGTVKIKGSEGINDELVIRPGEQAIFGANGELEKIEIDEEEVIAWKRGVFRFSDNSIDLILRQISRWYDVELEYQKKVPDIEIAGEMPRSAKLTDIVSVLKSSGLDIRLDNKKLIVK